MGVLSLGLYMAFSPFRSKILGNTTSKNRYLDAKSLQLFYYKGARKSVKSMIWGFKKQTLFGY